jgi:small-conductance mechanosensitive channel
MRRDDDVCSPARRWVGLPWLVAIVALGVLPGARAAEPTVAPSPPATAAPAQLKLANRSIVNLRAEVYGATAADRVRSIEERLVTVVAQGGPLAVTTRVIEGGIAVLVDGRLVFRVLQADVDAEAGETADEAAARAASKLQQALDEMREARDSRAMLTAIGVSLLATLVLLGLLWLLIRGYRRVARRLTEVAHRRAERLATKLGHQTLGQLGLVRLVVAPVRVFAILIGLLLAYEWLGVVLGQFPYTRPWGEALLGNLLDAVGQGLLTVMSAIPGLLIVLIVFLVARFFVRVLRAFFTGVEQGRVQVAWVDETTAKPTGQVLSAVIWLLALVAAYPYIPGSDSEAFKGIGVFVGLMLSIGSSGVVNQAVSGLMLMYTRSFRPGEFVKVGDTEGTVRAIGFLTTQIETLRREQITIPNAVIVGNVMRNFSRMKQEGGVRVTTAITIGYDTPWRQVRGMLQLAADRTAGILRDPPPRILQTGLLDHAVEYTMLVCIAEPTLRPAALDELHANIQDVFNEHGVQIMSPRYEADPAQAKVVPPGEWFKAPAVPPAGS